MRLFALTALMFVLVQPGVCAGASTEGTVVFYASMTVEEIDKIVKRFQRRHPEIAVQTLRMTSALIPPRIATEQRGGTYAADVISCGPIDTAELVSSGALQRYPNPEARHFLDGTVDPGGLYSTLYMDTTVIAWNTTRIKASNVTPPASLADLTKPEWNGKIGLDSSAFTWYFGITQAGSGARSLLKQIAANRPLITNSHAASLSSLAAGEFDVTPTVYGMSADLAKAAGQPIDFVNPKPVVLAPSSIALAKNAPHPLAAKIFIDWLLSQEGQRFLASRTGGDYCSARTDVVSNPQLCSPKLPFVLVHPPNANQYNESIREFRAMFGLAG